jgi:hypothetical protein
MVGNQWAADEEGKSRCMLMMNNEEKERLGAIYD